ncbi:MAG: hypothetical protein NUW24_01910 [Anaerolineae bacterium]|jgi:hypothetical protein|nr:hypothetical protein [Anaerolineae bacterium]MDH7473157.1 hypothetical protein [Anaerolineae bacterium]
MDSVAVSENIARIIDRLEAGTSLDDKLTRVLENEIRRRLARYEWIDRQFQRKYGMTLEEFEQRRVVEKQNYSFEVESDHQDWDQAVDGIKMLRQELAQLRGKYDG